MAIAVRGTPTGDSDTNGADVTITFSTGAGAPLEGDVVIVAGGHGATVTTLAAPGTGYTQLGIHTGTAPIFGAWYKVMGPTPDLSVVCSGGGNASDGVSYCSWVLSGVDSAILDQTTVTAGPTTSTNPDCGSITTQTANAWVMALAGSAVNDAAIIAPSGYSNHLTHNGNDAVDITTAGATLLVASPAATNPPSWTNWASGAWYGITIALKAEVAVITGTGVLAAQTADVIGSGTSSSTGTGVLASQVGDVTGAGYAAWVGTGALVAQVADVTGVGTSSSTGTGALGAQVADVTGEGTSSSTGTGSPATQEADITGIGTSFSTGTGILVVQSASITGVGTSSSVGTGILLAVAAIIAGIGTVTGASGSTVTFFRGVSKAPSFHGVSKITLHLTDAGGGTYTVTRVSGVSDEIDNIQSSETHLIDGEVV